MPVMNGYEATDRIRQFIKRKNLPQPLIIALTGHSHEDYINKCWRHSIDEVQAKPINVEVMKQIMNEIIEF